MFLVFGYDNYYPAGGINDCIEVFPEKQDALDLVEKIKRGTARDEHGHRIYPSDSLDVVEVTEGGLKIVFYTSYRYVSLIAMGILTSMCIWEDTTPE